MDYKSRGKELLEKYSDVLFILLLPLMVLILRRYVTPAPPAVFGIPIMLLFYYAYTTGNRLTSTIAGIALTPLDSIYSEIPDIIEYGGSAHIFRFLSTFFMSVVDNSVAGVVLGPLGYLAATRRPAYIVAATILFGLCMMVLLSFD